MADLYKIMVMVSLVVGCRSVNDQTVLSVINGDMVASRDFPAGVTLERRDGSRCGGGVVGPDTVITAAHCLAKFEISEEDDAKSGIIAYYFGKGGKLSNAEPVAIFVHKNLKEIYRQEAEKVVNDSENPNKVLDVPTFFRKYAALDQGSSEDIDSYQAVAVHTYEFRGPEGKKVAPYDFAVVVFPPNTFAKVNPIYTEKPPKDVFFAGTGVITDDLEIPPFADYIDDDDALDKVSYRGTQNRPFTVGPVFITTSSPQKDGHPDNNNSSASVGDSGIPLWASVPDPSGKSNQNVTLAVQSSGGYWLDKDTEKAAYYGRYDALPPQRQSALTFERENVWVPALSKASIETLKEAMQSKFKPQIQFFPANPEF